MDDNNQNDTSDTQQTPMADEQPVAEEQQAENAENASVAEEAQETASSEEVATDQSEDAATSTDQSVSKQGEDGQSVQAMTSTTPSEPVAEGGVSLTGENEDIDQPDDTQSSAEEAEVLTQANDNPNAKWYVVHTYSGHENKVATALKQRVESEHLENQILDVLVPTQDKIEIRSGKKTEVKEKIFPGYILVRMVLDDNSWLAVRTTQGVTGFVGIGNKPTPIPEAEVKTIVKFMTQGAAPTFKDVFLPNDTVKIIDGPFSEFIGKVDSVDKEHGKVKVLVSIFGRETPVELDFLQVQKL